MWKLFQLSIMAAVMCGNIYYEWTPNPYAAGVLGVGAAFFATLLLGSLFGRRSRQLRYKPTRHDSGSLGARWDTGNLPKSVTGPRVCDDARELIEVAPHAPRLIGVMSKCHPLAGARASSGKLGKS